MAAPSFMRPPLNHSTSMILPMNLYNQHINNNLVDALIIQNNKTLNQDEHYFNNNNNNNQKEDEYSSTSNIEIVEDSPIDTATPMKLVINTGNNIERNDTDSFFPAPEVVEDKTESIDDVMTDNVDSQNDSSLADVNEMFSEPFINEGDEYQADIPEFRGSCSSHLIETKEDLLWDCHISEEACPMKCKIIFIIKLFKYFFKK